MIAKLIGIRTVKGTKEGKSYEFQQLQLVGSEKAENVLGFPVYSIIPDRHVDISGLTLNNEYNFFIYYANGRMGCNGIIKV